MCTFKLNIKYPYYRDMLGGGFVDTRIGFVEFTARTEASALKKVPRIVKKHDRKIDGDKYQAHAVSLVMCTEQVIKTFE